MAFTHHAYWEQQYGPRNYGQPNGYWSPPPPAPLNPPPYQYQYGNPKPRPAPLNPPPYQYGNSKPKPMSMPQNNNPFSDLAPTAFSPELDPKVIDAFQIADSDGNGFIDEKEMKVALASCGLNFNTRAIRLMMNTFSNSRNRVMGPNEFAAVYSGLQSWKGTFHRFDRDRNGKIDASELRQAFNDLDYPLSSYVLNALICMFDKNGGSNMGIGFESFIECCLTVKGLNDKFKGKDQGNGTATFEYEEFMLAVLPFIVA